MYTMSTSPIYRAIPFPIAPVSYCTCELRTPSANSEFTFSVMFPTKEESTCITIVSSQFEGIHNIFFIHVEEYCIGREVRNCELIKH